MRNVTTLRRARLGFSLIELLIVVAIIAALVGVAVPMFQQNILEAHHGKAMADLETLRKAILQHDAHERALTGISLEPLKGRYIQDLPKDPWGNDYVVDLDVGVICTFGGDRLAGGQNEDEDLVLRFRSGLKLAKVSYNGAWGLPVQGNKIRIQWTKPYALTTADPLTDLVLILDAKRAVAIPLSGGAPLVDKLPAGAPVPADLATVTWGATTWAYMPARSDPAAGVMMIQCTAAPPPENPGANTLRLSPQMGVNVKQSVVASTGTTSTSVIVEKFQPGGPLDSNAFGAEALKPGAALPAELVGDENRGVLIIRESFN